MDNINTKKIFAERLKELIVDKKLNNQKLSDAIGIPRTSISNWINGRRTVQIDALVKIAVYFGVTTDYLLGLEN